MSQLVRVKKGKKTFEVITNEGTALRFRDGEIDFSQVLLTDVIFKNSKRGDRHAEDDLVQAFGTADPIAVAQIIVETGEVEVNAEERKEAVEQKTKEILNYIHKNYQDPRTKLPHPMVRLQSSMENANFRIDPDKPIIKQAQDFIRAIEGEIMFSKAELEATLFVQHQYVGSCYNIVHGLSVIKSENYSHDGCQWEIGIAPGDFDGFVEALNKVTKGDYQFSLAGQQENGDTDETNRRGKKKKKGKGKKKGKKGQR